MSYEQYYRFGLAINVDEIEKLSEQQEQVLSLVKKWWKSEKSLKRYFVLGGCSGSGKSTLIGIFQKQFGLKEYQILNCALTGKAALVLRRKGLSAQTVHSSIYRTKKKIVDGKIEFQFYKLNSLPGIKLIIVDQASMISQSIFEDLLSFNIPVIFVGDHQQLPPVNSEFNLMQKTDYRMQKVLRQVQGSPIIQMSLKAIRGQKIAFGEYGQVVKKIHYNDVTDNLLINTNQIIVGTNKERILLNDVCRQIRGFGEIPQFDDKLIAISNNWSQNIFNGQIVYLVKDVVPCKDTFKIEVIDQLQKTQVIHACLAQSKKLYATIGRTKQSLLDKKFDSKVCHFNYGYAITAHNSQGSSWQSVMVFDDKFGKWNSKQLYNRWLYTCITRAEKELIIVQK